MSFLSGVRQSGSAGHPSVNYTAFTMESGVYSQGGRSLPGFMIPFGSNARLIAVIHRSRPSSARRTNRSEEHTSELQSLMRISYAVFCLKKKKKNTKLTKPNKT